MFGKVKDFFAKITSDVLIKLIKNYGVYVIGTMCLYGDKYMQMLTDFITPIIMTKIAVFLAFTISYFGILRLIKNRGKSNKTVAYIIDAIGKCRNMIDECKDLNEREFGSTVVYSMLRPYFSGVFKEFIEGGSINVFIGDGRGSGGDGFKICLLDELVRIEKEFGIV